MLLGDTIVAVSTPAGAGPRAIVRLSGPRAVEIADRVFRLDLPTGGMPTPPLRRHAGAAQSHACGTDAAGMPPHVTSLAGLPTYTAHAGRMAVGGLSVPATVYLMLAPRSYTREDVVEFHVGSWPAVLGEVVAGLVSAGARPAEPGEFTFRALMSGRLDLAQAEAVMAVVDAADRAALRAAEDLLGGHLSAEIGHLAEEVRMALALVEVGLDFSDQDIEIAPPQEIADRLSAAGRALADLGRRARGLETCSGRVRLVLAGRPNAGKSSLFNRLLAADRAIVSPEAGTTRDELRATLHIEGMEFTLSDTAGLQGAVPFSRLCEKGTAPFAVSGAPKGTVPSSERPEEGTVPNDLAALAEKKALAAIGGADLVLVAIDATDPAFGGIDEILRLAAAPAVVAVTKCDLAPADAALAHLGAVPFSRLCEKGTAPFAVQGPSCVGEVQSPFPNGRKRGQSLPEEGTVPIIATSAVTGQGIDALRAALVRAVEAGAVDRQAAGPVVTARHRAAMEQAAGALARATHEARRDGGAPEIVALELHEALDALGAILGRHVDEDLLGTIFSRFCIGK